MLAQILSNLIVQSAARIGDDEAAAVEFRRQAQLMIEMGESVAAASPSSAATHFLQAMGRAEQTSGRERGGRPAVTST